MTIVTSGEPRLHEPWTWNIYSAIVNVDDNPCLAFDTLMSPSEQGLSKVPYFWFPIQEYGQWGYAPFYGAARVAQKYGDGKVLIHCHAGVCRSVTVAAALLLAEGRSAEAINTSWPSDGYKHVERHWSAMNKTAYTGGVAGAVECAIRHNRVPSNILEFLRCQREHPSESMSSILHRIKPPVRHGSVVLTP